MRPTTILLLLLGVLSVLGLGVDGLKSLKQRRGQGVLDVAVKQDDIGGNQLPRFAEASHQSETSQTQSSTTKAGPMTLVDFKAKHKPSASWSAAVDKLSQQQLGELNEPLEKAWNWKGSGGSQGTQGWTHIFEYMLNDKYSHVRLNLLTRCLWSMPSSLTDQGDMAATTVARQIRTLPTSAVANGVKYVMNVRPLTASEVANKDGQFFIDLATGATNALISGVKMVDSLKGLKDCVKFTEATPQGNLERYFLPCFHATNTLTARTKRVLWANDMRDDTSGIEIQVFDGRLSTFIPQSWSSFAKSAAEAKKPIASRCRAPYTAQDSWHKQSLAYQNEYEDFIDRQHFQLP